MPEQTPSEVEQLRTDLRAAQEESLIHQESIAQLEQLAREDIGWNRLTAIGQHEFSDAGLKHIVEVCQLVALKNPLVKQACRLRAAYTWAQGVEINAPDDRVNKVVQDFIGSKANKDALFGATARAGRDRDAATDGNLFIACYTRPTTGKVTVRTVPFLEIGAVINNPDDRLDPWFYRHDTIRVTLMQDGRERSVMQSVWHPALGDHPGRPKWPWIWSEDQPVLWDAPMLHMHEDRLDGWTFGVPIAYAAIDWALAYKDFLSDWATLARSLSRFAWRQTGPGRKQAAAMAALAAAPGLDPATGAPQFAGATAMMGVNQGLEAIPKTGATIDANSGSPLANMVSAAFGFPITMLLGDPSRGDRSAADNLDRPTELMIQLHQSWWAEGLAKLIDHAIDASARAPKGHLRMSKVERDDDGSETVILAGGRDRAVNITFPELDEITPAALVDALVKADQTSKIGPLTLAKLLFKAVGVADVDAALAEITDDNGEFKAPPGSEMDLALKGIAAAKTAGPAPRSTAPTPVNPDDPDPDGADPAPSPARVRNRTRRGRQLPDAD